MIHRLQALCVISIVLLTACQRDERQTKYDAEPPKYDPERLDRIEEGAKRSHRDLQERIAKGGKSTNQTESENDGFAEPHKWIVNHYFSGCPKVSDWFEMQDIIQDGNFDNDHLANLPDRCIGLEPGTYLVAPLKKYREVYTYKDHRYESFSLENGTKLWGDGMDEITTSHLGEIRK